MLQKLQKHPNKIALLLLTSDMSLDIRMSVAFAVNTFLSTFSIGGGMNDYECQCPVHYTTYHKCFLEAYIA